MPDPTTPNLGLYIPLNGADVGTWDVPANANMNLLDSILGGNTGVALSNVPVTLSAAQYNNAVIRFTGTLTADVTVTMPPVGRIYTFVNNCDSAVTFNVTIACSTPTTYVCLPPNEPVTVLTVNGANVAYINFGHCGEYWDFAGSAVPRWVTGSNPQPYLNCDGTAFSSATYPNLRDYLGANTLPDARGRYRASLNQGTARISASVDGDTLLAGGGQQALIRDNIPNYDSVVTDVGHSHLAPGGIFYQLTAGAANVAAAGSDISVFVPTTSLNTAVAFTGITVNSGTLGTGYAPPTYIGGLTLIRTG